MNNRRLLERLRTTLFVILGVVVIPPAYAASNRELEQRINAMDIRIARMEKLMNNQVLLEMLQRLDALQKEIQQLRGDSERANYELDRIKTRQRELYLDIDRRLQQLGASGTASLPLGATTSGSRTTTSEPALRSESVKQSSAITSSTKQTTRVTATKEEGREEYLQAFNLLKDGRYDSSASAFTEFLSRYPQSSYAANAQYWLAEANYVAKKYTEASAGFKTVVDSYPNSVKVPDARLKLGFTYYELEQWDKARKELTQVRNQYPNSTVARLAQKRLQRMDKEGH